MEWAKVPWLFAVALLAAACGGDDGDGTEETICDEIQAKHDACGTGLDVRGSCNPSSLVPEVECATRQCSLATECDEFRLFLDQQFMSAEQVACYEDCGVLVTGMYSCADGSGAVGNDFTCDGIGGCPDGSDETGCP